MADGEVLRIEFPGDPPDTLAPPRLRLETSGQFFLPGQPTSASSYDQDSHTLRVFLAAGDRRTVRFLNADQTAALPSLPDAADAGIQIPVTILGFRPRFEMASRRWYADIQVNADKAYMPFFRLAVVRYQPMSISEAISTSRATTLDVIQPLPTRQLSVIRHGQDPQVQVTLRGTTYLENDPRLNGRVTCSLFTADSPNTAHWRPVRRVPGTGRAAVATAWPTASRWSSRVHQPTPPTGGRPLSPCPRPRPVKSSGCSWSSTTCGTPRRTTPDRAPNGSSMSAPSTSERSARIRKPRASSAGLFIPGSRSGSGSSPVDSGRGSMAWSATPVVG